MKVGDTVVFHLRGEKMNGDDVTIAPETHPALSADDVSKGYVSTLIPASTLLSLGNGGMIYGQYEVVSVLPLSPEASARISWKDMAELSLNVTQFAPPMTSELPNAYSAVTLFGPPGQQIVLSVGDTALIHTQQGGKDTVYATLDEQGLARFQVYVPALAAGSGISSLVYAQPDSADIGVIAPASQQATFRDYQAGPGDIVGYAYTTGAAADGMAPCSVYIRTSATTSEASVRVTVTGTAVIKGHPHNANGTDIPLNPNTHCCSFDVTDMHAEAVTVTVFLNGSDPLPLALRFFNFPAPGGKPGARSLALAEAAEAQSNDV
jgi:hypothetical protein